jgi:MoxR-like ATPase
MAFYDRFLLRVPVAPVGDASFEALLRLAPSAGTLPVAPLSSDERAAVTRAAAGVVLGAEALAACTALRAWLAAQQLPMSDRRWRQWLGLMRTAAATEVRGELDALDLWSAPYVAAAAPADVPRVAAWFDAECLRAVPQEAPWLARAVQAFEQQLDLEQRAPAEEGDDAAGKLALARSLGGADDEGAGMLRIVASRLEASLRRRYSAAHVQARVAQVEEVIWHVAAHRAEVGAQAAHLAARLAGRLWIPEAIAARWRGAHAHTLSVLDALATRLAQVHAGFADLPVDDALPQEAPPRVALEA